MFLLGHLGIGYKIAKYSKVFVPAHLGSVLFSNSVKWVLLGALLPDIIDKALYYSFVWMTGKRGSEIGLICGTRTIGHTGLFLLFLFLVAWWSRKEKWAAIALGQWSHLILDLFADQALHFGGQSAAWMAVIFPLNGFIFYPAPFKGIGEHLGGFFHPFFIFFETLGAYFLYLEFFKLKFKGTKLE